MNLRELKMLVGKKEGQEIEFKRTTGHAREGLETLCGMLNATGHGTVVFGVTDDGKLLGQEVSEKTMREISNGSRSIEPHIDFTTDTVRIGGNKYAIVVSAGASGHGPFTFDGRPFIRVGNTTQRMSHSELKRRFGQRLLAERSWDKWQAGNWKTKHLDAEEISRTVEDAVNAKRLTGVLGDKIEVVLRRLDLLTDTGLTHAAAILFGREGKCPNHPSAEIRLARFRGTTKDEFRDNRQYRGHAFSLLQHAERFLDEHLPVASRFVEGKMRRVDTPQYPPLAYREAIINAIIHRDYSQDGGAVSVALFDDRLEIWSTGLLPEGVTVEKLKGIHESKPRNPLIADVFYRRGLIEKWGRGTNTIIEECKRRGCPEPEFEEIGTAFVVRFRPAFAVAQKGAPQVTQQDTPQVTPQVISVLDACDKALLTREEVQFVLRLKDREHVRKVYIEPLIKAGWLQMSIPAKPNSRNQRYLTTALGRDVLLRTTEGGVGRHRNAGKRRR